MAQEISTGVFFPSALAQDAHLKLVGVGVRKKLVFHVYAFGLYLDTKVIYKALKPTYAHHPVEQLNGDGKFWDALLNEDADKGLVLVMHRKISGDLLNEAFNVSLMERIQSIGLTEAGSKAETGSKAAKLKDEVEPLVALGSFKKFFAERNLKAGSKLTFHCGRGGVLTAFIDGEEVGKIVSPILCAALLDIYVGAHPIDPRAKTQIATSIHKLLSSQPQPEADTIDHKEEELVQKAEKKSRLPRRLAALKAKL